MEVRDKIREVTLKIIELFGERMSLVEQVKEVKSRKGLPVRDKEVEKSLWLVVREKCKEVGLSTRNCERMFSLLISSSLEAQIPKSGAGAHIEIFRRAKEMEQEGKRVYHLEVGEPAWGPPEEAIEDLFRAVNKGEIRYGPSTGLDRFREAASNWVMWRDGVDVSPDSIVPTPGSKFAIFSLLSLLTDKGDRIGLLRPTWPGYLGIASALGLEVVFSEDDFENLRGSRVIIVCSPNNPDGKVLSESKLESLVEVASESNSYIISDDAYAELSFVKRTPVTKLYERAVSVNSMSKAFGMTGFRIGYVYGPEDLMKSLAKFLAVTITNVPEFIQEAAATALEVGRHHIEKVMNKLREMLQFAEKNLKGTKLRLNEPDGGLYLFPRVEDDNFDSLSFSKRLLEEKGVAVAPGIAFGPYPDRLRITYASVHGYQGILLLKEALS